MKISRHRADCRPDRSASFRLRRLIASAFGIAGLLIAGSTKSALAQTAVSAGSGSYASALPTSGAPGDSTYYGPSISQLGTLYNSLYIAPSLKNQAIPTNHWWTDLMTSFRQQTVNGVVSYTQSPFGDNLWVFPEMVSPTPGGMVLYYPSSWVPRPSNGVVSAINAGPSITVDAVAGGHAFNASNPIVTGYGDWNVSYSLTDSTTTNATITTYLARGVPFVWVNYANTSPMIHTLGNPIVDGTGNPITASSFTASQFAVTISGKTFGVFAPPNTSFTNSGGTITANFGASGYLVYALMPDAAHLNEFAQYAYAEVTGSQMTWTYNRTAGNIATTWTLTTNPLNGTNTQTLQGWLPHHYHATVNNLVFKPYTYVTARGTLQVSAGNTFQITWPFRGMAPELPAPTDGSASTAPYSASQMTTYMNQYAAGNHPGIVGETYGQGKELGQAASYMAMADQLGMTSVKSGILANEESVMNNWFTYTPGESSNYFGILPNWGALIGIPTSYGTIDFNDNHFHYGYYVLAAALTGLEDPTWLNNYAPMVTMVAKEYANWDRTDHTFPFFRTFDVWEGHSWAGGFSSANGENQESSSEAVNSWVGLFMLGNMLGNQQMADAGAMGYAMETSAVNEYWQDWKHTNFPSTYGFYGCGILASQQIQYQNFFSADPVWEYAIQYVPINHWNDYLGRDPVFLKNNLAAIFSERAYAAQNGISGFALSDANNDYSVFGAYPGDYVLGAQLTVDPTTTATEMANYLASNLDIATDSDGLPGQVYYLAHTLRTLGTQDLTYYTNIPTSAIYYNASTGVRTAVIYNPQSTAQTATVYYNGSSVTTVNVPAYQTVTASVGGPTTPLPTAPTGLTATAGNGQVSLAWNAVSGATSYNIYRQSGAGSYYITGVLNNSYTDTGLANGGNVYTYQVYAVNSAGQSQPSSTASARLIGTGVQTMVDYLNDFSMVSTYSAGMGINGSNGQYFNGDGSRASRSADDTEYITYALPNITTFAAKVYTLNGPVTTVKFYTSVDNGSTYQPLSVSYGTETTSEFDKLPAWGYYNVIPAVALPTGVTNLKIEFNAGTGNAWDPELSQVSITYGGTPTALEAAPTGLTASAASSQVNVAWNAVSGATSYTVYRTSLAGGVTYAGLTSTSFADTNVVSGVSYTYEVCAVGSNGTSIPSTSATVRFVAAGTQTVTDPLSDFSIASSPTANIAMDTSNPQYFGGDSSRVNRVKDDTESFIYSFPNISNFTSRVYALNGPVSVVKFYTSVDNGTTYQAVTLNTSARGGPSTGWGYYDITPSAALPSGVTNLKVELNSGTGNAWDPQVSQVAITYNGGGTPAPPAPTGLTATAGNAQVSLSWSASSGATSYNVYRGTAAGGESATPIATGLTGTTYTDTSVTNGTAYYYKVAAVNSGGTSPLSSEASATPVQPAPSAPTGLSATPGNAQVSLSWTASTGATSYNVYRGTTAGGESATAVATGITGSAYTNTGLTNGTAYYFTVKAVNAGGTSPASNEASATPQVSAPSAPTGLTATGSNTKVTLGWTASTGAASYNVYRGTTAGGESATAIATGVTTASYTDTSVTNGTAYFYKVAAVNAGGTSGMSNEASATPSGSATITDYLNDWTIASSHSANWTIDTSNPTYFNNDTARATRTVDDTEYLIYTFSGITTFNATVYTWNGPVTVATFWYSTNSGSTWTQCTVNAGSKTASASGWGYYNIVPSAALPAGVTNLKVQFASGTGNAWDPQLSQISITYGGATPVPPAPTGLAGTAGNAQVSLSWTGSTGATSYNVYRGTTAGGESATAIATGLTGTTYTNTGLTNGTTYYYTVAAVNAAGTSAMSNEASATPSAGSSESPYGGTPWAIPGTVEAENYDLGGEGVAYHDTDATNNGGQYRTSDGVDIEACTDTGGGYDVGWTAAGEWMKYTVNVATAGTYTVSFRVAAPTAVTGAFHLTNASGTNITGAVNVPATGGWQTWATVNVNVTLAAGQQILTLNEDAAGWNINNMSFALQSNPVYINAGGSAASPYVADVDFIGGTAASTTATIDTTQLTGSIPPQAVLQTERYGNVTYTIPGFTAGSSHAVTLYFAEEYWTATGQRTFNVSINGTQVLSNFDIFASAGGANKAIQKTFTATANASGQYVITFTTVVDNAKVDGIAIN